MKPFQTKIIVMHSEKIEKYSKNNNTALQGGGQDRIKAQHDKGKLTARERINLLVDEGTFTEIDPLTTHHYHEYEMQKKKFFTDGVVGGYGNVNGRQIFVFAYDFTVLGGTLSQMGAKKITKVDGSCRKNWLSNHWHYGFWRCKNSRRNYES